MNNIRIPAILRRLTGDKDVVQAAGTNISEVLTDLNGHYPDLQERFFDEQGAIRRGLNVFLNDEDIRFLEEMNTSVKDGDEISIVAAFAGG